MAKRAGRPRPSGRAAPRFMTGAWFRLCRVGLLPIGCCRCRPARPCFRGTFQTFPSTTSGRLRPLPLRQGRSTPLERATGTWPAHRPIPDRATPRRPPDASCAAPPPRPDGTGRPLRTTQDGAARKAGSGASVPQAPPQARPPGPSRGRRQAAAPLPMRSRLQPRGRAGAARSAHDRRQGLRRLSARVQQQGSPGGRDATCGGSGRSSGARTATGAPLRIARLHRSGERCLSALGPVLAPLTAGGGGGGRQETGLPSWPCCGPGPPSRERSFAACTPLYAVDRLVRWPVGLDSRLMT